MNLKANIFKSFFTEKCPFLTFFFLSKSHGGGVGGVGMKHLGPLDLNKPKTFSYWDFKNFNISNLKVNIFQSFFINIYGFFEISFSKYHEERGGEWGKGYTGTRMWWRNIKAQRKCSKLEFKEFFKVLKFLSLFHQFLGVFSNFFYSKYHGREVESGGKGYTRT